MLYTTTLIDLLTQLGIVTTACDVHRQTAPLSGHSLLPLLPLLPLPRLSCMPASTSPLPRSVALPHEREYACVMRENRRPRRRAGIAKQEQ